MSILRQLARKIQGPRCHLPADEKAWIEGRLLWFKEQFGSGPIRRTPLDPTSDLLPKKWDGSYEAGEDLFRRLSEFMLVGSMRMQVAFYTRGQDSEYAGESHSSGPAGLYHQPENDKLVIALESSGLARPASLAATICHELGHVHLLADQRIERDEEDCEPLTDLLTVYFGAGILTANAAFQFSQWQGVSQQGWQVSRQGYLSEALFGYALACFSWYRGDLEAKWQKHLRENILYYFEDSLHFLSTTHETLIPFNGA